MKNFTKLLVLLLALSMLAGCFVACDSGKPNEDTTAADTSSEAITGEGETIGEEENQKLRHILHNVFLWETNYLMEKLHLPTASLKSFSIADSTSPVLTRAVCIRIPTSSRALEEPLKAGDTK